MNRAAKTQPKFDIASNILYAACAASIVLFTRVVPEAFDLPKTILVLITGPLILLSWALKKQKPILDRSDFWIFVSVATALTALVISGVRNPSAQLAWIGQEHRFTGVIFWTVCLVTSLVAYFSRSETRELDFAKWISIGAVPFLMYGILQMYSRDPFQWNTETFASSYIFSTQGNPNFASWTAALTYGFGFMLFMQRREAAWGLLGLTISAISLIIAVETISVQGVVGIALLLMVWLTLTSVYGFRSNSWSLFSVVIVQSCFLAATYLGSLSEKIWIVAAFAIVISWWLRGQELVLPRRLMVISIGSGVVALAIAALVFSGRISNWVSGQAGERSAFYRASFSMIVDSPWIGHGFDRYGRIFTRYRPAWHAQELPLSISGSAHSIWLGLFVSGGVLLVLPLLALVFLSWRRSWKWLLQGLEDPARIGAFAITLVMPAIWFFSVEQASVIFVTIVIIFLGLGRGRSEDRHVTKQTFRLVASTASLSILFVLSTLSSQWIAGNRSQNEAFRQLFSVGNINRGLDLLEKSVRLGPLESEVRAVRSKVYFQLGNMDAAASDALWVAREYEYSGYGAIESAEILLAAGKTAEAVEVLQGAIRNNPYYLPLQDRAEELLLYVENSP